MISVPACRTGGDELCETAERALIGNQAEQRGSTPDNYEKRNPPEDQVRFDLMAQTVEEDQEVDLDQPDTYGAHHQRRAVGLQTREHAGFEVCARSLDTVFHMHHHVDVAEKALQYASHADEDCRREEDQVVLKKQTPEDDEPACESEETYCGAQGDADPEHNLERKEFDSAGGSITTQRRRWQLPS